MSEPVRSFASLPAGLIEAIRSNAGHFPAHIRERGRQYLEWHRIGVLEFRPDAIAASVRGQELYRTEWRWTGGDADPRCTCPVAPVCKHAYALAQAILNAYAAAAPDAGGEAGSPAPPRPSRGTRARTASPPASNWKEHAERREQEALAADVERWAREHATPPQRALRVVLGMTETARDAVGISMEVFASSARSTEGPRSGYQLLQMASELRRTPAALSPPHARLMRLLDSHFLHALYDRGDRRFVLDSDQVNRLLDSFSDSSLVTWGDAMPGPLATRAGITAGARLGLGDHALEIVPACMDDASGMRVALAARWPDGRQRPLSEIIYLASDDPLHPSLVLADGEFWRVGEEPPHDLLRRFAVSGSLAVPEQGRERFLELLSASFSSVAEALAPHTLHHAARPVITLDLRDDDWLQVRLFAHTGDPGWRPGERTRDSVEFEYAPDGRWTRRRDAGLDLFSRGAELVAIEQDDPALAEGTGSESARGEAGDPEGAAGPGRVRSPILGDLTATPRGPGPAAPSAPPASEELNAGKVWLEAPEPARVDPARTWLAGLPLFGGDGVTPMSRRPNSSDASVGWWMRLDARNLERFAEVWDQRPPHVTWLGNENMQGLLKGTRPVRAKVAIQSSGVDWFSISAEWEAEGARLTDEDLARLRAARTRFVKLKSGWVRRDLAEEFDAVAATLADLGVEVGGGEQRVSAWQLAQARPESFDALVEMSGSRELRHEIEALRTTVRAFHGLPRTTLPAGLVGELRPYQKEGLDFLAFVTGIGLGAILADDMGLGKTVQALAWWLLARERDPSLGPALVVCPASVVHNWQREAARFAPGLRVLTLGRGEERHALRQEIPEHDLVITNYALLRRDIAQWKALPLGAAILDEAQNVKNPDAAVSRAVFSLNAKHRLALTGTPLENRALDLWSLMQFVNPGYLGSRRAFVSRYDAPDAPPFVRRLLSARLRPVTLRRLKSQVAQELPERIEERRDCQLTPGQRQLYLAELARSRALVSTIEASAGGLRQNKIEILAALTRLRQVCCHPALAGGRTSLGSGKFDALFELLEPLLAEGHKVLVFSQFVECLKLIAGAMDARAVRYHMLTGATVRREEVVDAFESDPEPAVFLISLKAGGTGLNLTSASYVVLFDPWWNPAVEAQAIDRTHRIGQTRTVIAYRMLAEGTIEEKIWELQQRKAALARDVLGEEGFARGLTRDDLQYLLSDS